MQGKHQKRRVHILVKAFPQPSTKHEETVCCAGVTEDGRKLLRLYPIRYPIAFCLDHQESLQCYTRLGSEAPSSLFTSMLTIISGGNYGDHGHDRTRKTF